MSYAASQALQRAIYTALSQDSALAGLVGTAIFDALPAGAAPDLYVALGPEDVSTEHDSSGSITRHRLIISVIGCGAGFAALKAAAGAVSDCLDGAAPALDRGHLVTLDFLKARARRSGRNRERRIDLWFRAIVEDS